MYSTFRQDECQRCTDRGATAGAGQAEQRSGEKRPVAGATILVVEDDPDIRALVAAVLEGDGYRVLEAGDGEAALELVKRDRDIALVFTDIMMPGALNGVALAREARRINPGLKLLFASGYADARLLGSLRAEMDRAFVGKPYRPREIARRVELLLAED